MNARCHRHTPQSGLSLLELAIVLVIIGLVAGLLAPIVFESARQGKVQQGRLEMEALRREIIGHVVSHDTHQLPLAGDAMFDVSDVWGRPYHFHPAPSLVGLDICAQADTANADLAIVTPKQTVAATAFVLTSDGPDHDVQVTTTPNQIDASSPGDDLVDFVTMYQLFKIACGSDGAATEGVPLPALALAMPAVSNH